MGGKQSHSFRDLSQVHMEAFLLYADAKSGGDEATAAEAKAALEANVQQCKSEVSARLPGAGLIIGGRFVASMYAELQLLDNPEVAIAELRSCHATMASSLCILSRDRAFWEHKWASQLESMVDYLISPGEQARLRCLQSAEVLGVLFDELTGTKLPA